MARFSVIADYDTFEHVAVLPSLCQSVDQVEFCAAIEFFLFKSPEQAVSSVFCVFCCELRMVCAVWKDQPHRT